MSGPSPARDHAAATLLTLPGATARRLHTVLDATDGPEHALAAVADGSLADEVLEPATRATWRGALDATAAAVAGALAERGTRVLLAGDDDWPLRIHDRAMPPILLAEGERPGAGRGPCVAVVGTRRPSPHGAADAAAIAHHLVGAGATVVSGLAHGIDGAAHEGAVELGGTTIGVTATGLDVVYPAAHTALWGRVRSHGLVVSERAFGTPPRRAAFPVRNRIIVGAADAVVIVEAAAAGGAMRTAGIAADLGVPVFAVPGSRRNPVAAGCNRLLAEGAVPLIDPLDVTALVAGVSRPAAPPDLGHLGGASDDAARVLRALAGEPATLDQLVARTGAGVGAVAAACRDLERRGALRRAHGRLWPM